MRGAYRSIGINRNDFLSVIQMRSENPVEWIAFASNAFNVLVPFYTDVEETPAYVSNTAADVSTDNFYWVSRLIAAMADASYKGSIFHLERYQEKVMSEGQPSSTATTICWRRRAIPRRRPAAAEGQ